MPIAHCAADSRYTALLQDPNDCLYTSLLLASMASHPARQLDPFFIAIFIALAAESPSRRLAEQACAIEQSCLAARARLAEPASNSHLLTLQPRGEAARHATGALRAAPIPWKFDPPAPVRSR